MGRRLVWQHLGPEERESLRQSPSPDQDAHAETVRAASRADGTGWDRMATTSTNKFEAVNSFNRDEFKWAATLRTGRSCRQCHEQAIAKQTGGPHVCCRPVRDYRIRCEETSQRWAPDGGYGGIATSGATSYRVAFGFRRFPSRFGGCA